MDSEAKVEYSEPTPAVAEADKAATAELNVSAPGTLSKVPSTDKPADQQFNEQLSLLVERLNEVFREYKQPITTVGIALTIIPFIVVTVALLKVINAIPLLSSTFELIGFGFTSWFIYRYLLFVERRQELSQEAQNFKERVLGKNSSL